MKGINCTAKDFIKISPTFDKIIMYRDNKIINHKCNCNTYYIGKINWNF